MTAWRDRPADDRRRLAWWAVVVVCALTVAAVLGGLAVRGGEDPGRPHRGAVDAAVASVTELMTFAPDDDAADRAAVAETLTGPLAADYARRGPAVVFPATASSDVSMTVEVTDAAPVSVSGDSARILVFATQTIEVGQQRDEPARTGVARWAWMTKVDDRWLLMRLSPVSPQ